MGSSSAWAVGVGAGAGACVGEGGWVSFSFAGIAEGFKPAFSLLIFALFCTLGVGVSAWRQSKIEEKYLVR